MNRMQRAVHHMIKRMGEYSPTTIVYHRGDDSTVITDAMVGRTAFRTSDQFGTSRLEWGDRDFLIPVSSLVIDGVSVVPNEHDWIEEITLDSNSRRAFELVAPNDEPVWRYADQTKMLYRIHTKNKETL